MMGMIRGGREQRTVHNLVAAGFVLMMVLLLTDAFVGIRSLLSIRETATRLVEEQYVQMSLIDEVQREQGALSAVFYQLAGDPDSLDRARITGEADAVSRNILELVRKAPADSDQPAWRSLGDAARAFDSEVHRLLSPENAGPVYSRELLQYHEAVVSAVAALIRSSHGKARAIQDAIQRITSRQLREDALLLGGCLLLAALNALLVLRGASSLYRRMQEQSEELSRVSWQLLDNQERTARRLSHELHDELGQVLTALKTHLGRHASAGCADQQWLQDCSELLKDSIRSAHEISQLLRPTILDDFGLGPALAWLCEKFEERSGIEVDYSSEFGLRLPEETETHLFRIAQEALTNVARHSKASKVQVRLRAAGSRVELSIRDNGVGLPPASQIRPEAFGLTGMRARARSSRGELSLRSEPGKGVEVAVWVPAEPVADEEEDPHLVG
jgi:signal transduction histidine kinase